MINNMLDLIGNTPIVKLNHIGEENIFLKLEKFNPAGSIKDRAVLYMIEDLERRNILKKGDTLVEASSGNTGIALSMIGALKGYNVVIVMPETMSVERRATIKAYGAELILTPGTSGMDGSIKKAQELLDNNKNYKSISQFKNKYNTLAHYETTAQEILVQVKDVDIFVAGVGTGGTISGVGKRLKELNKNIKIIAIEPETSPAISKGYKGPHRIQGIGAGFIPDNYDASVVDEVITVSTEEAFEGVRLLGKKEGILAGISSGANVMGAMKIGQRHPGKKIVTVAPDGIEKYLSENIL